MYNIDANLIPMIAEARQTKGAKVEILLNRKTNHVYGVMERTPEDFRAPIEGEIVIGHDFGEKTIEELEEHVNDVVTITRQLFAESGITF